MKDQKLNRIAMDRINKLYNLSLISNEYYSKRYIILMERIAKRMDITLPVYIKKSYCKKCKLPYKNERIRIKNGLVIITCPNCGDVRRIPIKN
ncbi:MULTISPECIES: ribonuclease P protein component 4 [Acidiplasma]|jgi:ribonuclease P protein subunit RPR2|uniref:Ribonuclease P protein component 4 n=2 Tax=Acidiplasma TaxID=507753 RepID=A0A0N8VKJ0_9ARCH|nr:MULTISPECIES: hypothetical protein [Acidiplasma]KJE50079.1 hypothetical protein TZ01_00700 [Acidiplasma sp. MBA-1]KPV45902.1 hypothetical protein SE19_07885 [Acidiplasma aeolicum]KQB33860.1 hypothetical protein AOG55_01905 [Acidiplasma cupricumulans]KQB35722.1 hypothetical protein AOG54_08610 [Acidiplasma aeolicum]WMT55768.1 MAG: ribonuclease P [Acidiplasma sp.]